MVEQIFTHSEQMQMALKRARVAAKSNKHILLTGETGSGKELFTEFIHAHSHRSGKPLVRENLDAFSESLLEAQLFGHIKGAFTDAKEERKGLYEAAEGGTLMIDEIDGLPLKLQSKLLRVIETKAFCKVGSMTMQRADVRMIFTSQVDLHSMADEGTFRPDLYERISIFEIQIPPLRDRKEDIPDLVRQFLVRHEGAQYLVPDDDISRLAEHDWPRNVRELENAVIRAILEQQDGVVFPSRHIRRLNDKRPAATNQDRPCYACYDEVRCLKENSREYEHKHIRRALAKHNGNVTAAAKELIMKRTTLETIIISEGLRR